MKKLMLTEQYMMEQKDLASMVYEYLKSNPNPKDKELHDWTEKEKLDVHEVESEIYKLATKFVQHGKEEIGESIVEESTLSKQVVDYLDKRHSGDATEAKKVRDALKKKLGNNFVKTLLKHGDPDTDGFDVVRKKWLDEDVGVLSGTIQKSIPEEVVEAYKAKLVVADMPSVIKNMFPKNKYTSAEKTEYYLVTDSNNKEIGRVSVYDANNEKEAIEFIKNKESVKEGVEEAYSDLSELEKEYDSKSIEELVKLKKKLYSNVDISSPKSPEEKALERIISKKFSDLNQEVIKRRNAKKEAVKEGVEADPEDIETMLKNMKPNTDTVFVLQKTVGGYSAVRYNKNQVVLNKEPIKESFGSFLKQKAFFKEDAGVDGFPFATEAEALKDPQPLLDPTSSTDREIRGSTSDSFKGIAIAKGVTEKDVNAKELKDGIKIEMEHTNDPIEAKQIALDHLAEVGEWNEDKTKFTHKPYYKELKKLEKKLEKK
jgi:hypothetical protein